MRRTALLVALLFVVAAAPRVKADAILTLRVTPAIAREPASLKIVAIIPADDRNCGLDIVVHSDGYERSSHIQLDGREAQRVWNLEFRDVPRGDYNVIGTLTGSEGRRATVMRVVVVMP